MFKKTLLALAFLASFSVNSFAIERLELDFFADESSFKMQERKKLVNFLEKHELGNVYEFEMHSLADPLKLNLDVKRLTDIQAIFRQYDVNIDGLLSAKIRFVASDQQLLVVIRKTKQDVKENEK